MGHTTQIKSLVLAAIAVAGSVACANAANVSDKELLLAFAENAADASWKPSSTTVTGRFLTPDTVLVDFIDAYVPRNIGKDVKIEAKGERIGEITQTFHHLPYLGKIATLQAICARHGFVVNYVKSKRKIVVSELAEVWGTEAEAWELVKTACAKASANERDLGKVAYLMASLLAFGKKGTEELLRQLDASRRPEVQYICVMCLMNAASKIDVKRMCRFLVVDDREVRFAAMYAVIVNSDPLKAGEAVRNIASEVWTKGSQKERDMQRKLGESLDECLNGPVALRARHMPFLKTISTSFSHHPELEKLIKKRIKQTLPKEEREKEDAQKGKEEAEGSTKGKDTDDVRGEPKEEAIPELTMKQQRELGTLILRISAARGMLLVKACEDTRAFLEGIIPRSQQDKVYKLSIKSHVLVGKEDFASIKEISGPLERIRAIWMLAQVKGKGKIDRKEVRSILMKYIGGAKNLLERYAAAMALRDWAR